MEYDPTLLKLSVWGQNREQAISRLRGALSELRILGVQSNQALFWAMTKEKDFNLGNYSTSYLPLHKEELKKIYQKEWEKILPLLSQIVIENSQSQTFVSKNNTSDSIWEKTSLQTPLKGEF
jgi:acetyl/propionyl-CoA carboxylase alpha subunit